MEPKGSKAVDCRQDKQDLNVSNSLEREVWFITQLASELSQRLTVPSECLVDGQYHILQCLGSGAYGNVFKVKDRRGSLHALKIIKTRQMGNASVKREVDTLSLINQLDPFHSSFIVRMFKAFYYHQHLCILYELLGPTVHCVLALNKRVGFPLRQVRDIAFQITSAANFLHRNRMVHHDIKPDNVAFVYPAYDKDNVTQQIIMRRANVKLIDFGSTVSIDQHNCKTATTRQYRSPELGLHYNWSLRSDVWSIGCVLFEMYYGKILFPCECEAEKCYLIEAIFRKTIPSKMGKSSNLHCFDENGRLKNDSVSSAIQQKVKPFQEYRRDPFSQEVNELFDLMEKTFVIWPEERITSDEMLIHDFFNAREILY